MPVVATGSGCGSRLAARGSRLAARGSRQPERAHQRLQCRDRSGRLRIRASDRPGYRFGLHFDGCRSAPNNVRLCRGAVTTGSRTSEQSGRFWTTSRGTYPSRVPWAKNGTYPSRSALRPRSDGVAVHRRPRRRTRGLTGAPWHSVSRSSTSRRSPTAAWKRHTARVKAAAGARQTT
jgi:hypothetical protein